jgi:hypothetical protein
VYEQWRLNNYCPLLKSQAFGFAFAVSKYKTFFRIIHLPPIVYTQCWKKVAYKTNFFFLYAGSKIVLVVVWSSSLLKLSLSVSLFFVIVN